MSRRRAQERPLTTRERAVIAEVGWLRLVTGAHLESLHFTTGSEPGRRRRSQATLRRLATDGYLHRLPRRTGGHGGGSASYVYQLGYRGQKLLWPTRRARTPEPTGPTFAEHTLAIADTVVALRVAERAGRCRDLRVELEPTAWRRFAGGHGQPTTLKPDLTVRLNARDQELVWFVEIDRATETLVRISRKAQIYLDYWVTGTEQERLGTFPRVLWSVPTIGRAEAVSRTLTELPDPASAMQHTTPAAEAPDVLLGHPINQPNNPLKGGEP